MPLTFLILPSILQANAVRALAGVAAAVALLKAGAAGIFGLVALCMGMGFFGAASSSDGGGSVIMVMAIGLNGLACCAGGAVLGLFTVQAAAAILVIINL